MEAELAQFPHYLAAQAQHFRPLLLEYGVLILMLAVAVEGFGIPAPGQTLLITAAVLSVHGDMNIMTIALAAWFAAVAGSAIGYTIGRAGGQKLLGRLPVNARRLHRLKAINRRYGSLFIVVSRFFDGLRQLGSLLVGALGMPPLQFLLMTSLGAALWVGLWALGVYWLDTHIHDIAVVFRNASPWTWALAGVLLGGFLFYLLRTRKRVPGRHGE